ncbi:E3 ubiquitin-protein ligase [Forsythia ovata]|uniref:E3 ubiquitin-protein ligase n=1 Tax=Forsythia ovata TaxID=205694 RepID=A0ABD1WDX8_9LAMI
MDELELTLPWAGHSLTRKKFSNKKSPWFEAQSTPPGENNNQYPYAKFSPSMAIIVVVLIAALFFMDFFSIYIHHCSDTSGCRQRSPSPLLAIPPCSSHAWTRRFHLRNVARRETINECNVMTVHRRA